MSEELKPCPFCNGEGVIYEYSTVETCPCSMQPAQPAEAEGVSGKHEISCWKCHEMTSLETRNEFDGCCWACGEEIDLDDYLIKAMDKRDEHYAALTAVTAERDKIKADRKACWEEFKSQVKSSCEKESYLQGEIDQLRAEVEALRVALLGIASVNPAERGIEWAKSYASEGLNGAGSEPYARWLEAFKEAEALRALLIKALPVVEAHAGASHMLDGFRPARNKWDDLVDGIRAAMAAKGA